MDDKEQFYTSLYPAAQQAASRLGTTPEVVLSFGALESGYGKHVVGNNLFGIKRTGDEPSVAAQTGEVFNGVPTTINANFRAYQSQEESINDFANFLQDNPRYKNALAVASDPDRFFEEVQKAGYATDPEYSNKLKSIYGGLKGLNASANLSLPDNSNLISPNFSSNASPNSSPNALTTLSASGFDFQGQPKASPTPALSYLEDFGKSTISGVTEVIGVKPWKDQVEDFRKENPGAGLISGGVGMMIPYGGYAMGITKIPKFAKAVGVTKMEKAIKGTGFASGFARGAAAVVPFEAARLPSSLIFGENDLGDEVTNTILNFGLSGAAGGLAGLIEKGGVRDKHLEELAENAGESAQEILRNFRKLDTTGLSDETVLQVKQAEQKLAQGIYTETKLAKAQGWGSGRQGANKKALNYVSNEFEGDADRKALNRLFITDAETSGKRQNIRIKRLISKGSDGFSSNELWQTPLANKGIQIDDLPLNTQFPRMILENRSKAKGWQFSGRIKGSHAHQQGKDLFYSKESDGLYVFSLRLEDGVRKDGSKFRRWFTGKSDDLAWLKPDEERWTQKLVEKNKWAQIKDSRLKDVETFSSTNTVMTSVDIMNYMSKPLSQARKPGAIAKLAGLDELSDSRTLSQAKEGLSYLFTPQMFQVGNRPLARTALAAMQKGFEQAEASARKVLHGTFKLPETPVKGLGGVARKLALGDLEPAEKGVLNYIDDLTDADLEHFNALYQKAPKGNLFGAIKLGGLPEERISDAAKRFNIKLKKGDAETYASLPPSSKEMNIFADVMQKADAKVNFDNDVLSDVAGLAKQKQIQGHLGIPHTWEGDHRIFLTDDAGKIHTAVGGNSPKEVDELATRFIAESPETLFKGPVVLKGESALAKRTLGKGTADNFGDDHQIGNLLTQEKRSGVQGYVREFDKEKLKEVIALNMNSRYNQQADLSIAVNLEETLSKLEAVGDRHAIQVLTRRWDDMAGRQGKINSALNKSVDKVLSPVLGKNSASKIVAATNKYLWHMSLGAMTMAYPVMNALTFIQTVLPQVAYLRHAPTEELAKYYQGVPLMGQRGVKTLSSFRIMSDSFKQMSAPDKVMRTIFNKAANDAHIDPRLLEEFVGESATKIRNLKGAMQGEGGFAAGVEATSSFLGSTSERLSRIQSLATGKIVGEKFLRLEGDELYRFATQFTDNTMFRYGAADRPVLFGGPIGSTFGLFKNWMFHYMYTMGTYANLAGQGINAVRKGDINGLNYMKPLLWQTAGTGALGGVSALPFSGVMDSFSKMATDQGLMENIYSTFNGADDGTGLSDTIYLGLPAMFGLSLSTQSQAPFSSMRDLDMMVNFVHMDRSKQLFKTIGKGMDYHKATGDWNALHSETVREGLARTFAPKTFYRSLQVKDGQLNSLNTGDPIVQELGLGARALYALGFNTPEIEKTYAISGEMWNDQKERRKLVQAYGKEAVAILEAGDSRDYFELQKRFISQGGSLDSLERSVDNRLRRKEQDQIESKMGKEGIDRWRNTAQGLGNF